MKTSALRFALCTVVLVGCSSSEDPPATVADTGGVVVDTGGTPTDTGGTPTDTGGTPTDTGGTPTDTGGTPTDTGGGGETAAAPTCTEYCDTITANCTGAKNTQYIDKARCMTICAKMTVGVRDETSGDTVGCRLYHATAAKGGADLHCPHAGMTGGNMCGADRCDSFCKLSLANCSTKATTPFKTEAECKTICKAATHNATAAGGELDQAKKSLNCMQYHLQAAYESDATATAHCGHLTTASGPCG